MAKPIHPNLRPWKPGQSGNPKGRPPNRKFGDMIAAMLDQIDPDTGRPRGELIAEKFMDEVLKQRPDALREFLARAWPTVSKHEVSGPDGGPIDVAAARERLRAKLARHASKD